MNWGGALAAIPGAYNQAQQQMQAMADEEAQRQLRLQQFQTNQRQAPLQDQLLRAQITREGRPDINQMRYADERAATIQGQQLSPFASMPGAQPMPQPPQGMPQAFQGAQPMQGVSPGMPSQGQPQPQQGAVPMAQPMPQGQPQGMYQQPAPAAMQAPQGQEQGAVPQAQPMPQADPVAQWEQQAYGELQQRVQALPPARSQQEQYQRALAVRQAQQMIQEHAKELRVGATEQLRVRTELERERANAAREDRLERGLSQRGENAAAGRAASGERAQLSSQTAKRDAEVNLVRAAVGSGEISIDAGFQKLKEIDAKYGASEGTSKAPAKEASNPFGIPDKDYTDLEAAVAAKFPAQEGGGYEVPPGTILSTRSGKKYKFAEDGSIALVK